MNTMQECVTDIKTFNRCSMERVKSLMEQLKGQHTPLALVLIQDRLEDIAEYLKALDGEF